jgi:hypothetical protein
MALHPEAYQKARKRASLHLQIELNPIDKNIIAGQNFPVAGRIVRIFRENRECRLGQFINFNVAVLCNDIEDRTDGILWLNYSNLVTKKYMEVYLNGKIPNFSVALCQNESIDAPTEHPVIPSPPHKWWNRLLWIGEDLYQKVGWWLYEIKWRLYEITYKMRR